MAAAKGLLESMGPPEEADDMGEDMDLEAMQAFIDAVKAGDAEAALAAWNDLPHGDQPLEM